MNTVTLELTGRDPIVSRDGRPFGSFGGARGNRMRSVAWPLPSVVAGSFRTALGKAAGPSCLAYSKTETFFYRPRLSRFLCWFAG